MAPWCCNVSRTNVSSWVASSLGALAARRQINQASTHASPSSETGSIRFYSFSLCIVVFACVLCLILSENAPTTNSSLNSCFGYDLLLPLIASSMRITQATISVNIKHFLPPSKKNNKNHNKFHCHNVNFNVLSLNDN